MGGKDLCGTPSRPADLRSCICQRLFLVSLALSYPSLSRNICFIPHTLNSVEQSIRQTEFWIHFVSKASKKEIFFHPLSRRAIRGP